MLPHALKVSEMTHKELVISFHFGKVTQETGFGVGLRFTFPHTSFSTF